MRITEEQIERANSVNLPSFLMANGFNLKKVGREYSWKEHDSLHIKDNAPGERGSWFRFSTDEGGDNISFVQQYMGKSFVEAVETLNNETYVWEYIPTHKFERKPKNTEKTDIVINENTDSKRVFGYLCGTRGLEYNLIAGLVRDGKIVQEQKTGNAVFKIFDENNRLVGAEKVGTSTQKKFKGIATGSASGYGFEVVRGNGENAMFFESAVDMLSYLQMHEKQLENHRLVSMMGVKPSIVIDTMERCGISPENVFICSDNDKAGNEFYQRLTEKYPQMKRVFPNNRYKDWNDMLRGIPKEKEEVGKVTTYGNKTWNDATDNRDKTLVSMNEDTFTKLKNQLDNSGINYFAYAKNDSVVMAVNDKDIDWLKQIAGNDNLPTRKSNVEYIPPQKNIIGNAEYRYISDKQYISADRDTVLKMAEIMLSRNVQFSGRIYPNGKATLTVSGVDLAHVQAIQQNVIAMRKQFAKNEKADEIIGNKAYRDIRQRQFFYSKLTPEQYKEVQPYLDTDAQYSGLIRDNKVIFTVEKDDSANFHRALENAQREVGIINTLKNNGIDDYRLEKLSAVIHRFAVEDIHESLDSFFTPQLDEKQFDKMLSLVNDYLAQAVSERYGEYSGLNAILDFKNEIDRMAELDEFFSEHNFNDEQKSVISEMFAKDLSKANVEVIDETFTPDEIREYYDILHNQLDSGDVAEFLENRVKPELTDKEKAFLNGDIVPFMAKSVLAWDEIESIGYRLYEDGYISKYAPHENSLFGNGLSDDKLFELAHSMQDGEDIRKELSKALLGNQHTFITSHDNEFTVEYGEYDVTARYGNAERHISYEDLGDAFFKLFKDEYDDIIHDRTVEDLRDIFPDITDETADKLINAFDGAVMHGWQDNEVIQRKIKKALYEILGDEENTEKAFVSIADMKYNFKVEPKQADFAVDKENATLDPVGLKSETVMNVYHGTTADFDVFKPDYRGAVWTTTDFESAKRFAGNSENSKVYEVTARLENPKHIEFSTSENWNIDQTVRDAISEGFDGAVIDFKFTSAENDFYKFALKNHPDTPAEDILSSIVDAMGATAFLNENETISEFDKRMQENDYIVHSYVAVFDSDKLEINDKISVFEPEIEESPIHFGLLGNGVTAYDTSRTDAETNDYVIVAHISPEGVVKIYDDAISDDDMAKINNEAHSLREKFMAEWDTLDTTAQLARLYDKADTETLLNMGKETLSAEEKIAKYMPFVFFGEGERPQPEIAENSLEIHFGTGENSVINEFAESHTDCSFALANAVFSYMDEKLLSEKYEGYDKADFEIISLIDGENFEYSGRFDIGTGDNPITLLEHIRSNADYTLKSDLPYVSEESKNQAKYIVDTLVPFLEKHSELTVEEQQIFADFKAKNPIHTESEKKKTTVDDLSVKFENISKAETIEENKDLGSVTMRKVGSFYEMYGENAQIAANVLGLHLTTKNGEDMVGFPDTIKGEYADKLRDAGYFVMIEEVFELNPPKREEKLMSDISEVVETPQEIAVNPLTIVFNGDSDSLNEIKDKALSLGATCTLIASGLVVDTYENHKDELLSVAYELGLLAEIRGEEIPDISADNDTPLFADADVIEKIEKSENASDNRPFYEMPDVQGEQLSLFGDSVPLVAKKMPKQDKEVFAEGLFVGNVNRFSALHDEIMRGSGFENGKFRIEQFYKEKKPTNKEFADFLKNEYGIGGHSGDGEISFVDHDSKGVFFKLETDEKFKFTWSDVAEMTSAIIDKGEYITQGDIDRRISHAKFTIENANPDSALVVDRIKLEQAHKVLQEYGIEKADEPAKDEKATIIEVGDKFRNKMTGEISEVISLTGALPWYTEDCTVRRESGGFAIEENVPYSTLFDTEKYEYLGKGEVAEKADISAEISDKIAFEVLGGGKLAFKDNTMQVLADIDMNSGEISYYSDELSDKDKARIAERAKSIEPKQTEMGEWTVFTNKNDNGVEYGYIGRLKDTSQEKSGRNTEWCEDYFSDDVTDFNVDFARAIARQMNEKGITDLKTAREFVSTAVSEREKILSIEKDTSLVDAIENDNAEKRFDFKITDDSLGSGGAKTKFKNNVAAIELLKKLERENRPATDEEKEVLSKYVGWGGIAQAFDKENKSWESEYSQLKELLTDKEYTSARASTLDAFYTSPTVIDGIYEALANFGFEGGNVLEPALGVGNFFGRMPEEMKADSKLYGTEIDSISGRIAQKIYPDADITIQGFEKNTFQDGCFDVAVGNVPFGELGFTDSRHGTSKLHDYFFAETLDKVKSGGIVAFVTSAGTLDKRDESTRKMLSENAEFIGAIRLPGGKDGAFKENAGTEVTTDIIFLQKKGADVPARENNDSWLSLGETADGLPINAYFAENPDMVLGTVIEGNKLYGSGTMVIADENSDLKEQLKNAVSKLSATISDEKARDVYAKSENGEKVKIPSNLRNYSFFEHDNNIYFKVNNVACKFRFDTKNSQFKRAKAFINLRDLTRELIEAQELNKSDDVIKDLQTKLNTAYDDFYKKYGLIHSQTNKRYFSDDVSYNLVAGLEKKYEKTELKEKSDIFFKRTIQPPKAVEHVETAMEALTLSVAERAGVDFEYMSSLTGMTEDELKHDLQGEIYKIPHSDNWYQTASEYLSGDIRLKLQIAEEIAEYDSDFAVNVNALKSAMPTPLKAGDIDVKLGATWIDPKYYEQFMYELFQTPRDNRADMSHSAWQKPRLITAEYSEHSGSWHIANKSQDRSVIAMQQYGSKKMGAYEIMEHLLNLKEPKIYKTIEVPDGMGDVKEKRVVDIDATRVVQKKADKIRAEFKKWIFKDQTRREEIVDKYNELFNSIRPREFDGSALQFPMMNSDIHLHEHQKNAIAHAMFGGNTLFAHCVGAGKTYEMIATAMESKRLGLCTKSLFAVPNHLTEQIGDDFQKLYPGANILVATKKDFQKENRQQLFAKIATGNFDAVIIGHSQLGMIPLSKERQEMELQSQIDDIILGIAELKASEGSKFQIKAMERTKKSLEKQLDKLQKNHDDTITFEQLGVDKLFVDEAHEFKNLFCPTKLNNISGISNSASQKALDLYLKCRYLDEKTGGKGVTFATGTPLSNSVTELHTMMRYLEYDFLKTKGLQHFDNWVTVFGEQKTDWELAPAGNKFKERTRIAQYTGLPELMSMFKQIADIRTADTLKLDVPDCEYKIVNVEATPFQKELVEELADRADAINAGNVDPSIDNMLKITSDGRKLGLDPRLIDPSFEDNPNTKLNQCVENVARIHAETAEDKLTQIIFCDLGVPHKSSSETDKSDDVEGKEDNRSSAERESLEEECDFCVYDDIKAKLVAKGIPESEIAYIHDAKTEKQKSELFDKVRSGEIRVLLGRTT